MSAARGGRAETADVVIIIIGGGVAGLSVAYHLARAHRLSILVLERGRLGDGSTTRSAGGIRCQFATTVNIRLSLLSRDAFSRFAEETGVDPDFRPVGYCFLLTEETEIDAAHAAVTLQRRLGGVVECLDPPDLQRLLPAMCLTGVVRATYSPGDGYANPERVIEGYAKRALDLGVRTREGCPATGIVVTRGRIRGVKTPAGRVATPIAVNAAGPEAATVGRLARVEVPVRPYRRQLFLVGPVPEIPGEIPITVEPSRSWDVHAPATGQVMAQLILGGTGPVEISALSPDRFRTGKLIQEPMTMHGQQAVKRPTGARGHG